MERNSDGSISDFQISGQSFIEENYHNSRTSNDIDVKPGPVTKLEKKNTVISKKSDDGVILEFVTRLSFLDLWPIWSNSEVGVRTYSLQKLHFH